MQDNKPSYNVKALEVDLDRVLGALKNSILRNLLFDCDEDTWYPNLYDYIQVNGIWTGDRVKPEEEHSSNCKLKLDNYRI